MQPRVYIFNSDAQITPQSVDSLCIHEEYIFGRMGECAVVVAAVPQIKNKNFTCADAHQSDSLV